jgi:hypothetical protein
MAWTTAMIVVRSSIAATGALVGAGFETLAGLPDDLDGLRTLHGVGPAAIERLKAARAERSGGAAG